MFKKVNVYPTVPVYNIRPVIINTVLNVTLSVGDIRNCIFGRARVEEILPDGKIIKLDLSNYNKCNYEIIEHIDNTEELLHVDELKEECIIDFKESIHYGAIIEDTSSDIVDLETVNPEKVEENSVVEKQYNKKKNKR